MDSRIPRKLSKEEKMIDEKKQQARRIERTAIPDSSYYHPSKLAEVSQLARTKSLPGMRLNFFPAAPIPPAPQSARSESLNEVKAPRTPKGK